MLVLMLLCACGGDTSAACDGPIEVDASTPLPDEIEAILARRCHECHGDPPDPTLYAPFPLTTWEQVQAPRAGRRDTPIYEVIAERIDDPQLPMPPIRSPQLTEQERETLHTWIDECAPSAP